MANDTVEKTSKAKDKQEVVEVNTVIPPKPTIEGTLSQQDVIHDIMKRVEKNATQVDKIVDELVNEYCKELDDMIAMFRDCLNNSEEPVTEYELDEICLKLPSYLYFVGEAQEKFGIKEDIAKSVKMELYNNVHQRTKGTIADKQAASEAATMEEDIVHKAYQRAYKRIKQKLEAAYEILASIKKVIGRRETEMQLSNIDSARFRKE